MSTKNKTIAVACNFCKPLHIYFFFVGQWVKRSDHDPLTHFHLCDESRYPNVTLTEPDIIPYQLQQ